MARENHDSSEIAAGGDTDGDHKCSQRKEEKMSTDPSGLDNPEPGPNLLDIIHLIPLIQHNAERFISAHPEHEADVRRFLEELYRMASELKSSVYARQRMKAEGS
jgi:hypothetical protein